MVACRCDLCWLRGTKARHRDYIIPLFQLFYKNTQESECKAHQKSHKRNWGSQRDGAMAEIASVKPCSWHRVKEEHQVLSAERHMVSTCILQLHNIYLRLSDTLLSTDSYTQLRQCGNGWEWHVFQQTIYKARPQKGRAQ